MPKPKKRGRRAEIREEKNQARLEATKRKPHEARQEEDTQEPPAKRQKYQDAGAAEITDIPIEEHSYIPLENSNLDAIDHGYPPAESIETIDRPFYGLLQDEEQEYFRRADELLEMNDFPSPEERSLFLANVYREAEGKELKIACSQSCSRLMERLILLSSTEQKKILFGKFMGNWTHLIQHRFASHCCEALFVQSGRVVSEEMVSKGEEGRNSMEGLFLQTLDELENSIPTLLTSKFASHSLRALLVVLSGKPLEQSSSLLQSKKKENNTITGYHADQDGVPQKRAVPSLFKHAVEKIISDIVQSMEPTFLRILTTHPTGNPTLQLLLELELTASKSKKSADSEASQAPTLLSVLLPDSPSDPSSESEMLLTNMLYHPVGSHFLEVLLQYSPSKLFKSIYTSILLPKITSLARNDVACYPLIRALTRLSKDDLQSAISSLLPSIPDLVSKQRTIVIKVLFERCPARKADASELTASLDSAYGSNPSTLIQNMLSLDPSTVPIPSTESATEFESNLQKSNAPTVSAQQIHASLLAQAMLSLPGPARDLILSSILSLTNTTLLRFALFPPTSRILQACLTPSSYPDPSTTPFHRKLLTTFLTPLPNLPPSPLPPTPSTSPPTPPLTPIHILAPHPIGSFILESIYRLTTSPSHASLFVFAERVIVILAAIEGPMQSTGPGRKIWKGWGVGTWKWDPERWGRNVRAGRNVAAASAAEDEGEGEGAGSGGGQDGWEGREARGEVGKGDGKGGKEKSRGRSEKKVKGKGGEEDNGPDRKKSAIELARERFAAEKHRSVSRQKGVRT